MAKHILSDNEMFHLSDLFRMEGNKVILFKYKVYAELPEGYTRHEWEQDESKRSPEWHKYYSLDEIYRSGQNCVTRKEVDEVMDYYRNKIDGIGLYFHEKGLFADETDQNSWTTNGNYYGWIEKYEFSDSDKAYQALMMGEEAYLQKLYNENMPLQTAEYLTNLDYRLLLIEWGLV